MQRSQQQPQLGLSLSLMRYVSRNEKSNVLRAISLPVTFENFAITDVHPVRAPIVTNVVLLSMLVTIWVALAILLIVPIMRLRVVSCAHETRPGDQAVASAQNWSRCPDALPWVVECHGVDLALLNPHELCSGDLSCMGPASRI